MKFIPLVIFTILFSIALNGQELTQTIKGTVVDQQSQFPLIGVNVVLLDSDESIGTTTDVNGEFEIQQIPIGRRSIQVSYLGYETAVLSNLVLTSAKALEVNISLTESVMTLDEIVVTANNEKGAAINQLATVSARTLSIEEAGRYSGSFNDPARMAQNFAGVSGASDDRNDIIIRGNSPSGVLWRMEGIDIPSPNHFATLGTTGGPISMLNINNLSNSDFMTSAWSADYGNALSGVFDLKLRNGNNDKREYVGQVGFNGFEFGAEGPFRKGKRSSYLLNYRYSTLGVFDKLGINIGTGAAVPQYQDVNFKFNIPTKKSGTFSVWGMAGVSDINFSVDSQDSTNLFDQFGDFSFQSKTYIGGASHTYFFNNNTYTKLTIAASGVQSAGVSDSISTQNPEEKIARFVFDRWQYKYSAHLKFNTKISSRNTLTAGLIFDYYQINMVDSTLYQGNLIEALSYNDGSPLQQSYVNWQHRFNDNITVNIGLHQQYFALSKKNAIEPRLGLKYKINEHHTLNLGGGLHSQTQPIVVYFSKDLLSDELPNKKLDFSKAAHFVLGHDFYFAKDMRLKTEIYYQYLFNIPVDDAPSSFSMINAGADFTLPNRINLVNEGTATNYGLELTLEKFFSQGYYFLSTASLFESKYKGSDRIERNSQFNGNFVLNALAGKEFQIGKNKVLSFDTKITYAGGKRYTPINLEASIAAGTEIRDENLIFSEKYPDYFKLDFKVSFKLNGKKSTQEWAVDLTNLTGQKNIFQQTYSNAAQKINTTYQRGFFPNILYRILF